MLENIDRKMTRLQGIKKTVHRFLHDPSDQGVKKRQDVLFFGGLGFLLLAGIGFFLLKETLSSTHQDLGKDEDVKIRKIDTVNASVDVKKVWVDRLEEELDLVKKQNEELKTLIEAMAKKLLVSDKDSNNVHEAGILSPDGIGSFPAAPSSTAAPFVPDTSQGQHARQTLRTDHLESTPSYDGGFNRQLSGADAKQKVRKLNRVIFNLVGSHKPKNTIDHFVPAGTFVKGRLISGVVASTAVSGASNPQPIHMELTHYGNLPRAFKTDLKQCFLIGSAYGDLPSERVYMRLETLSCVERRTQEVIEIKVDGYVSGEDGANGMRGVVIDKSGPAIRNAFLGGFLSGVGDFIGSHNNPTSQISPFGVTSKQALNASQMLQGGAGKGVGNAMEKMADFYIKRAEQLQPVIEIEPGREIDVVFKAGFDMNQTLYRDALKRNQDRARLSHVSQDFNGE